jgi:hypothetical protein
MTVPSEESSRVLEGQCIAVQCNAVRYFSEIGISKLQQKDR